MREEGNNKEPWVDDHVHNAIVARRDAAALWWVQTPHVLDLFRFVDGDAQDAQRGLEIGIAPDSPACAWCCASWTWHSLTP